MAWNEQLLTARRAQVLSTGDIGHRTAEICQIWRGFVLQTSVNCHAEFVVDPLWYIQPVQLVV